jgi:hypothetical protein
MRTREELVNRLLRTVRRTDHRLTRRHFETSGLWLWMKKGSRAQKSTGGVGRKVDFTNDLLES